MQQYTKQQVEGSIRYSAKCLIGNWNEEVELQKTVLKDFDWRKETGTLVMDRYKHRMSLALADVELTKVRDDPYVHFGDVLQLSNVSTGAVLCNDVEDKDARPGENSCSATSSQSIIQPCARNTFVLAKYKPHKLAPLDTQYEDDILHYGQKVRIVANPMVVGDDLEANGGSNPLCLFSRPVSTTHYAKYSRHQVVGFTTRNTYDTVWQVATPDPAERLASQGVEVMAGVPIVLVHCATKKPLCQEAMKYPNDFGMELEVSAHVSAGKGVTGTLEGTAKGSLKASLPRAEDSANHWVFVAGDTVATLPSNPVAGLEVRDILQFLAEQLANSTAGIAGLERKLTVMDTKGNGDMLAAEFAMILSQVGLALDAEDVSKLVLRFAADRQNMINVQDFLASLRPLC